MTERDGGKVMRTHTVWCSSQIRGKVAEHVDCANCPCHSGEPFHCPACDHRSGSPVAIDIDETLDRLKHDFKWDPTAIDDFDDRVHEDRLVRDISGVEWIEVCHPCSRGSPRCSGCGRVLAWYAVKDKCRRCHNKELGYVDAVSVDSQRSKVYAMESRVFRKASQQTFTTDDAKRLLKRLSSRFHVDIPRLENLPRRNTRASGDYNSGRIRAAGVDADVICVGLIIHEFAHHLNRCLFFDQQAHGASYVRALYEAMLTAGYAEERPSQGRWKVRIGKHSDFWDEVKRHREGVLA